MIRTGRKKNIIDTLKYVAISAIVFWYLFTPILVSAEGPNAAERLVFELVSAGFGALMLAGGSVLDTSIQYFVVEFAELYLQNFGGAIELAWEIIRDLINISLIFGLIYVGFKFILNSDESGAKKNLVTLIIAALLVNFSLFFAKFIVDVSNIIAQSFAQSLSPGSLGIAGSFADVLNLGSAFGGSLEGAAGPDRGTYWDFIFMLMVTLLVAAFVFFAGGILIIVRFIAISFLLIFSPILVLGWIYPFFSGLSRTYLSKFLGQAFMAPALLLCLYISFLILSGLEARVQGSLSSLDGPPPPPSVLGSITFFILGMGFLIGSLIIAQKMGAAGAATAVSIGRSGYQKAGRMAKNGAVNTGRFGARVASAPVRYPTRMGVNALGESAQRRFGNLQARSDRLGQFTRNNTVDRVVRGATNRATNARFGTIATNEENRDYSRQTQARANQQAGENARREAYDKHIKTLNDVGATELQLVTAFKELGKTVKNMTAQEKQKLSHEQLTNHHVAANLSDKDVEGLESSGRFSTEEVRQIRSARGAAHNAIATNGSTLDPSKSYAGNTPALQDEQRAALVNRSAQEVGNMPVNVFTNPNMAEYLTPAAVEQRMKNGNISRDELRDIRDNLRTYLGTASPSERTKWINWTRNTTYGGQLGI